MTNNENTSTVVEVADLSKAPLPTAATLKKRQSLAFQATRFIAFNAKMMRIVLKGH